MNINVRVINRCTNPPPAQAPTASFRLSVADWTPSGNPTRWTAEQIEVIAGQTPDKRADSLGGQVNLKTRSPLAMSERRRISYNASARFFPSWSNRAEAVAERPWRPDVNVNYTEVFDVGGGRFPPISL